MNAKVCASDPLEEPDHYDSAISLLLKAPIISAYFSFFIFFPYIKLTYRDFHLLLHQFEIKCHSFEPGLLSKVSKWI